MIHPASRTIEWMHQVASENNFSNINLIEKSIRAFSLLNASKAAYLSVLIANGISEVTHFDPNNIEPLRNALIESPALNKLNKLKKTNLEAFFYWNEISKIKF